MSDVSSELLKQCIEVNLDTKNIDIDSPGSSMAVLARAKHSKKYTKFFNECMLELIIASRIVSLQGVHWIMDL